MIFVENVKKSFRLYKKPSDRLKEIFLNKKYHREYEALKGVSFSMASGESIGILGENGAGKSTLLKIIMGVLLPDSGKVSTNGKVTGLLELGTGFNPEYSGEDNIYFNGAFLGLSRSEIDVIKDKVIEFAELGEFIHEPLKTYSSGMTMRLAFAIAIHANPQCFLVDEALSVGDVYFQQKCFDQLKKFKAAGGSFIFVSHDMNAIKMFCDRSIVLHEGINIFEGPPDDAVEFYSMTIAKKVQDIQEKGTIDPWVGNKEVFIEKVDIFNKNGSCVDSFCSGEKMIINISVKAVQSIKEFSAGILFRDRFGQDVFGINTDLMKYPLTIEKDKTQLVQFEIPNLNFGPGLYSLTVAIHDGTHHLDKCYHWIERAAKFEVVLDTSQIFTGIARLDPLVRAVEQKGRSSRDYSEA